MDARYDAPPDAGEPTLDAAASSADGPGMGARDAGDATSEASLAALGSCLGAGSPLVISGQMPYVTASVAMAAGGSETGAFVLDFGSTYSSIDVSAFPAAPATSGCDPAQLGATCTVSGLALFGASSAVTVPLTIESFGAIAGSLRQAGIAGTDLLGASVVSLDYRGGMVFASRAAGFCSDAAMTNAGFLPSSVAGFYSNELSSLEPATKVDSNAPSNYTVADVPTVAVSVAGVAALAQLDTGFDDAVTPFSVNVNRAFLAAILASSPSAVVRDATLDATLTTCASGVSEPVVAYRLASGVAFAFVSTGGAITRSYGQATLFVKETPDAASSCGGIGTWTVPAAQVGASFYVDMGALVLDPFASKAWLPKGAP